jgi:dTDP-4-dehydrorhamnose reductase
MEELVKNLFPDNVIIRTSNIIGNNPWNTHTLFNYLYNSLKAQKKISVVDSASRNVLDVDHFIKLTQRYLTHYRKEPSVVNIVNSLSYQMFEIISEFEKIFETQFLKDQSQIPIAKFEAPCLFSAELIQKCGIELDYYLPDVIRKYYPIFKRNRPA